MKPPFEPNPQIPDYENNGIFCPCSRLADRTVKITEKAPQPSLQPNKPQAPSSPSFLWLIISFLTAMIAVYILVRMMIFAYQNLPDNIEAYLGSRGLPIIVLAIITWFSFHTFEKERDESRQNQSRYKKDLARWQAAMDRYTRLFYCQRCDCVYIPGEETWAPAEQIALFTNNPEHLRGIVAGLGEDK